MDRRDFIAGTGGIVAGLTLGNQASAAKKTTPQKKPNILFIMTDQQSANMMSATGNKHLKTPAMDSLAASGVRFERAYAGNPVCIPNRFSLQTGLLPSAIGMGQNNDSKRSVVADAMIRDALGNRIRSGGYETVYGGKTHFPHPMRDLEQIGYRNLTNDSRQDLADACAKFLREPHEKPFFLFASFVNPHDICYMALNDHKRSQGGKPPTFTDSATCEGVLDTARNSPDVDAFVEQNAPPLPPNHAVPEGEPECITKNYLNARRFRAYAREKYTDRDWRLHRWAYCRLTEMVDRKIGQVLDALREAGLEKDTLIVFTSDHGDMDSAHKMEHKSVLYEEATRIPFIMSHKGAIAPGRVDDTHLVSNALDLLPTLCDYAGVAPPEGREGLSLRPLAETGSAKNWRSYVVVESQNGRSLRTERYKYVVYDSGERREQLIDLQADPGEMQNLVASESHKPIVERHRRLLKEWIEKTNDRIGAEYV